MKNIFYLLIIISLAACNEPEKATVLTMPEGTIPHLQKQEATAQAKDVKPGTVNPAHGQPGHTCAVAVGAIIPSAPNGGTQTLTPQQQIQQQLAAQQAKMATAQQVTTVTPATPKIDPNDTRPNPEHGKPGHRCDIPVGTPLNSKPGIPATTQVTQAVAPTAKGMNPPHGQPGHRCDIAVGAPLNSKPATQTVAKAPVAAPVVTPTEPVKIEQANGGVRN